jgi:hypothetical protein
MRNTSRMLLLATLMFCGQLGLGSADAMASAVATSVSAAATCPATPFIARNGVTLSAFPSVKHLSTVVKIGTQSVAGLACWQATSSALWLTVKPSSATSANLVLTAHPAGLPKNTVQLATVTVEGLPSKQTATISVALWIGSSDPATVTLAHAAVGIAANPVQPFAYVSDGSTSIDVFNVYTGQLVKTFTQVAPTVGALVVGSDGAQLFAVDTTNYKIIALDAIGGQILRRYQLAGPISSDFGFAYARPQGKPTLLAAGQAAIDVATGNAVSAPITASNSFYDPLLVATPNGARLAIVERGLSPGSIYTFKVSDVAGTLAIHQVGSATIQGENCQALAINGSGTRLYPACGWPYEFDVYDGNTLTQVQTLPAVPYPNNAVVDSAGNFVGGVNGLYETNDVFEFNSQGFSVGVVPTTPASNAAGQGSNLLAISGDASRVISVTAAVYASQTLMFRNLP